MKHLMLFVVFMFPLVSRADFQKIAVTNLDLDYVVPRGSGTVEKVGIGLGLQTVPYAIDLERTPNSFELRTPYVDFSWVEPLQFLYTLPAVSVRKTSAALGTPDRHFIKSEELSFQTPKGEVFRAFEIDALCAGNARGSFDVRLLEDCRQKLDLTIRKIQIPFNFFLMELVQNLPVGSMEMELPADSIVASIDQGNLFLQVYIRFWFYAGLRTWAHIHYENNFQTIVIRVDKIKFGYLTVTDLVMQKLKEVISNPDVKVDPPWIRIDTKAIRENHQG